MEEDLQHLFLSFLSFVSSWRDRKWDSLAVATTWLNCHRFRRMRNSVPFPSTPHPTPIYHPEVSIDILMRLHVEALWPDGKIWSLPVLVQNPSVL